MDNKIIKKLDGANMDIDLSTNAKDISWKQDQCPWHEADSKTSHKCAIKNVSICPYFCGEIKWNCVVQFKEWDQ